MAVGYWREVLSSDLAVPTDRPLDELTAELTTMLGSPDPEQRDGIAYPALQTWIGRGVYDDLLGGLGDGMAAGLTAGLGSAGDTSVFRRSYSVRVLADVLERDTTSRLLTADHVLRWGDQIVTWFLRERDLRGWVPGQGWAHALAHGADAVAALARSPHLGPPELTVMLDVLADRLIATTEQALTSAEPDRMAQACVEVLRRGVVPSQVVEPWVARVAAHATTGYDMSAADPFLPSGNCQAFLRALSLLLSHGPRPPAERADLLLLLAQALRASNPHLLHNPGTNE